MRILSLDQEIPSSIYAALEQYQGLRDLPREKVREVVALGAVVQYETGETIVHEGDPTDSFFLLLQGRAEVSVGTGEERRELGHVTPPFSLGEVGCLLDKPRTATVTAAGRVVALRLKAPILRQLFDQLPGFGWSVASFLADRLDHVAGSVGGGDEPPPLNLLILTTAR
jgi:CRP/FNR family cyclic AMP-dependent transcriptional regulator